MLRRPSSRRKSHGEQIALNLVPMMDTFVTLIAFLLYTMVFVVMTHVETPLPTASPTEVAEKLKEKPLQLTVSFRKDETEIWSPFSKIAAKKIPNTPEGTPDVAAIHARLVEVKQQFPNEKQVVLAPTGSTSYDSLVAAMDGIRMLDAIDPPIIVKNAKTGVDEALKLLFPEVIFGNILGND
ncbi:MAG: biopolymer transporter ExbD [Cryobacterium sp.]|nr:biopolymer transporter ExbD [Oligoflexia bacterium]